MSLPNNKWILLVIGAIVGIFVLPKALTLIRRPTQSSSQ